MVADTIQHTANRAAHLAGVGLGLPLHLVSRLMVSEERPSPDQIRRIRKLRFDLVDRDLEDALDGCYPVSLVFDRYALRDPVAWPLALKDFVSARLRRRAGDWKLDKDVGKGLPSYYRRRFHWQKDGYLSARSAKRYDLGVELLFLGAADTMRRRVIPPLKRAMTSDARILDVACGTGRTLSMLGRAMPDAKLVGVDLSPDYIGHARRSVRHRDLSLVVGNGEDLEFPDDSFDAVTSTFLFHELPRAVRRRVMSEMVRVCRPGGLVVVEDATQERDAGELGPLLHAFHQSLHEPFFADHLRDPLEDIMEEAGLKVLRTEQAYVAKVVVGLVPERE